MSRFLHLHIPEKYRKVQQRRGLVLLVCLALIAVAITPMIIEAPCCWRASIVVCAVDNCGACGCDYTCDGTADQVEINLAIQELVTCGTGGDVLLTEGNYYTDDSIVMEDYTWLRGSGDASVIHLVDDSNCIIISDSATDGHITLSNFAIDGNRDNQDGNSEGIVFTNAPVSRLSYLNIYDCQTHGIFFDTAVNSLIKDCRVTNCGGGIVNNGGIRLTSCSTTTIIGNTITDSAWRGIYLHASDHCFVLDNICDNSADDGFALAYTSDTSINGNTASHSTAAGFYLYYSANNIFSANILVYNGEEGIVIYYNSDNNQIVSNSICSNSQRTDNTYSNIYMSESSYCLIEGNLLRKGAVPFRTSRGINIANAASTCNMIEGNDLYLSGQVSDFVDNGTGTKFRDNRGTASCDWLADNEGCSATPTFDYEVRVVHTPSNGSKVEFAHSHIDLPPLDSTQEEWLINNTRLRLDPWNGGQRFVLFDDIEEQAALALLKSGNITAPVTGFRISTTSTSNLQPNYLRPDYKDFDGEVATRSQAVYYLENSEAITPQMELEKLREDVDTLLEAMDLEAIK